MCEDGSNVKTEESCKQVYLKYMKRGSVSLRKLQKPKPILNNTKPGITGTLAKIYKYTHTNNKKHKRKI